MITLSKAAVAAVFVALFVASVGQSAKPAYWCAVDLSPTEDPAWTGLHVTGSVPNNALPYLRIDGSQEWTSLHNIRGAIDDWTSRAAMTDGQHTADLIDYRRTDLSIGSVVVVASCSFVVPG